MRGLQRSYLQGLQCGAPVQCEATRGIPPRIRCTPAIRQLPESEVHQMQLLVPILRQSCVPGAEEHDQTHRSGHEDVKLSHQFLLHGFQTQLHVHHSAIRAILGCVPPTDSPPTELRRPSMFRMLPHDLGNTTQLRSNPLPRLAIGWQRLAPNMGRVIPAHLHKTDIRQLASWACFGDQQPHAPQCRGTYRCEFP